MFDNDFDQQGRSDNDPVNEQDNSGRNDADNSDWQPYYDFHSGYNAPHSNDGGNKPPKNGGGAGIVIAVCVTVFVLLIGLAAIGILGLGGGGLPSLMGSSSEASSSSEDQTVSGSGTLSDGEHSFTDSDLDVNVGEIESSTAAQPGVAVAQKVCPSVVGVLNYAKSRDGYTLAGTGSGIVLSEDGFIVTNQHVIDGADQVAVTLYSEGGMSESDSFIAQVVGQDSTTDIALLKIDVTGLAPATFVNSDEVLVGETVYAVGNPGGLELSASITQGLVSGLNRNLGSTGFIQTDVAINPGNSGGALVNVYGQVIGIISEKIVSVSDISAEGLGFAIPSSVAVEIIDELLKHGYVTGRVSLKVTVSVYTDAYAQMMELPENCRVYVEKVDADSNAARAGVRSGLFITHVNKIAVSSLEELKAERDKCSPGDSITMTLYDAETKKSTDVSFVLEEDRG